MSKRTSFEFSSYFKCAFIDIGQQVERLSLNTAVFFFSIMPRSNKQQKLSDNISFIYCYYKCFYVNHKVVEAILFV